MKNKDVKSSLRQRAEELARNLKAQSPQNLDAYPFADIQKMFHELQVHQIELELQNEELHQTQVELENAGLEERFCSLLNDMPDGFAHCRMVYDDQGHPADFLYLNVNKAFERLTGLKNVVGKPVTEVIPNIKELNPELFELYGKVVSTGKPEKFEIFFRPMEKWLDVSVTQSGEGCFAVIFEDITDRKRAEEALRRTDALLNSVIENTPNSLWFSDEHGTLLRLNQACRDILCLRDHEVVGKYNILKDPMLESQGLMPQVKDVFDKGISTRFIISYDTAAVTGLKLERTTSVVLDVSISPILDAQGKVTNAIIQHIDITERKRAERALRESESKLNLALDQTHLAYWEMDAATKTFTFNDRFYALYGTTAKREGGYRMPTEVYAREFMLPDERHIVSEDVARLLSGDLDQFQREHRIRRRDGQIRHIMVHVKVVRDASGRIVGTRGANQDITDLRRTEQALLLKNHVFDASIAANSIADTDGIMTEVNHTFLRIWGYPGKDAAVGKSITDFFNDFTEAAGILQVLNVTGQWKGEFKAKRWNGSTFFAHGQATILRDAAGEAIGYQSTVIDISDRKLAEEEGKKHEFLNRQLVKSESLARMAGAIAHHFNNQLATVIISLDMTKRALSQRDYSLEMLTEATQAAHRAAEMSTLMLTYLGQTSDKKEPLDIAETCLSYLPILRASMPHTVVLETDMPSHGPTAVASANQIKQALNNLMTNAWESIGTGKGSIRLVVKTVAAADIATINRFPIDFQPRESTYACLEVADSGNGICDTDIEKIFDPFFSSKFAGRGLGLAVVLGIIKSHQGAITVASNLGRGSVFRVFLPMLPGINLTKPTRVLDQTVKAARRAGTVLVIEDEASLRKAVIFAIREIGFTVLEAADGVQGTEIFQQHKEEICLVICDLTMPRQGGWETISALRKIVPGIPIILASGYNESQVMAGSHSDLPQAFLSKPYEFEALRDAITRVLEKMDPSNVP